MYKNESNVARVSNNGTTGFWLGESRGTNGRADCIGLRRAVPLDLCSLSWSVSKPTSIVFVSPSVRPPRRAAGANGDEERRTEEHVQGRKQRGVAQRARPRGEVRVEVDAEENLEDQGRCGHNQSAACATHSTLKRKQWTTEGRADEGDTRRDKVSAPHQPQRKLQWLALLR